MSNWLNHSSIVGKIGGYGDKALNPLSWLTHGKWTKLTSEVLPEKVNMGLSKVMKPFDKVDETINPVRKIPVVDRIGDIVKNKPGDAAALVAGSFFGASALAGGGAGGAGAGAGALGTEAGLGAEAGAGGTAMGGAAGTLGAADSALASSGLGLTAADVGGMGAAGSGAVADVGGLAAADSAAVDAEGAAPGLTKGYGSAPTSSSMDVQRYGNLMQNIAKLQQKPEMPPVQESRVNVNEPTLQNPYAASSKTLKTGPGGNVRAAMARGAAGEDGIDSNGVQAAAIQEISKRIQAAKKRLATLQGAKK